MKRILIIAYSYILTYVSFRYCCFEGDESLSSLSSVVKLILGDVFVSVGQALSFDQHVYFSVCSGFCQLRNIVNVSWRLLYKLLCSPVLITVIHVSSASARPP